MGKTRDKELTALLVVQAMRNSALNSAAVQKGPSYRASLTGLGLKQLSTVLSFKPSRSLPAVLCMRCCQEGMSVAPCKQHVLVSNTT